MNQKQPDGTWARTGPPAILVDPESATYHNLKDSSATIPINQDHSSMVKFPRGDPDLGVILHAIAQLCPGQGSENLKVDLSNKPVSTRPRKTELLEPTTTSMGDLTDLNYDGDGEILRDLASLMSSLDRMCQTWAAKQLPNCETLQASTTISTSPSLASEPARLKALSKTPSNGSSNYRYFRAGCKTDPGCFGSGENPAPESQLL